LDDPPQTGSVVLFDDVNGASSGTGSGTFSATDPLAGSSGFFETGIEIEFFYE